MRIALACCTVCAEAVAAGSRGRQGPPRGVGLPPRAILAHVGVAPQHARLMDASGESMKDTINDGDTLLVDISPAAAEIVEGKIYVFALGNEAYVKRLRRNGETVIMISDNRELFPPEPAPQHVQMRIFGRVKWAGRSL